MTLLQVHIPGPHPRPGLGHFVLHTLSGLENRGDRPGGLQWVRVLPWFTREVCAP